MSTSTSITIRVQDHELEIIDRLAPKHGGRSGAIKHAVREYKTMEHVERIMGKMVRAHVRKIGVEEALKKIEGEDPDPDPENWHTWHFNAAMLSDDQLEEAAHEMRGRSANLPTMGGAS
jgi:hypothetical protein